MKRKWNKSSYYLFFVIKSEILYFYLYFRGYNELSKKKLFLSPPKIFN